MNNQQKITSKIHQKIDFIQQHFNSPLSVMVELKNLSDDIAAYGRENEDKKAELSLLTLMLSETLQSCQADIDAKCDLNDKLCVYLIALVFEMLVLVKQTDSSEDYKGELENIGMQIGKNDKLMRTAIFHGLDVNWLIFGTIPKNIAEEQKELKTKGYLDPDSSLLSR